MKILWDLRCCQQWRERGIPRFLQNLILALAERKPDYRQTFLHDRRHPSAIWHDELARHGRFSYVDEIPLDAGFDWLICGCAFVPVGPDECVADHLLPPRWNRATARHLGTVVYDFIPWLYPKRYLPSETNRAQYIEALDFLGHQDLLWTISECTFSETARLFPQKETARQIVAINGGAGTFRGLVPSLDLENRPLLKKHDVQPNRYWIYIGGDDPRKNLEALIRAQGSRARKAGTFPLLIVCSLSRDRLRHLRRLANQEGGGVRFTGFVSDDALWTLLGNAYGLVFPSLYEGLGLPIIESYLVNTPVICSNTSSMKDLAPEAWRFDPSITAEIADTMTQAEEADDSFRKTSLAFWADKSHKYNWNHSADVLADSLERGMARPRSRETPRLSNTQAPGWFCVLPPEQSGVAVYNHSILSDVNATPSFVLYNNKSGPPDDSLDGRHTLLSATDYWRVEDRCSSLVFVLGNSGHHAGILGLLDELRSSKKRKIIYLHDGHLNNLWSDYCGGLKSAKRFLALHYPGRRAEIDAASDTNVLSKYGVRGVKPLAGLFGIREFIVHSAEAERIVRTEVEGEVRVHRLFHPVLKFGPPSSPGTRPRTVRIGSFGIAAECKGTDKVYQACKVLRDGGQPIELVLAGYSQGYSRRVVSPSDLDWVTLREGLSDDELESQMRSVDIAIQLREASYGEASGVVAQLLGMGKPLICSETGWFKEIVPFVNLVPQGVGVKRLAAEIQAIIASGCKGSDLAAIEARLGLGVYWQTMRGVL